MAGEIEVGRAAVRLVLDDSAFWQQVRRTAAANVDDIEVKVDADTAAARAQIKALGSDDEKITINADADTGAATTKLLAFNGALGLVNTTMSFLARQITSVFNVRLGALAAIATVAVAAFAPLTGMLTILGGLFASVAGGIGLLAAGALDTVRALGQHESAVDGVQSAQETAKGAQDSYRDSTRSLSDAKRDAAQAEQDAAAAVKDAERGVVQARQEGARARQDAAQTVEDAERAVTDAERQGAEQVRQAREAVGEAMRAYSDTVRDAREREQDATEALAEAERGLVEAVRDARERQAAAYEALADARESLADTERDAAEQERQAQQALAEAVKAVADARREGERAVRDAREAATDAAEDVQEAEEDLADTRRDAREATDDLRVAEQELRQARQLEPLRIDEMEASLAQERANLSGVNIDIANTEAALARAREFGSPSGLITELEQNLLELRADQQASAADIALAEKELKDARRSGTSELQSAEEAAASAREQELSAIESIRDAQDDLTESRQDAAEAFRGIARAEHQAAAGVREALRGVTEASRALTDTQRENAERIADAQAAIADAQRSVRQAAAEGRRSVAEAQRGISDARKNLNDVRRENERAIADARREIANSRRDVAKAQAEGARSVRDAERDLRRAHQQAKRTAVDSMRAVKEAQRQVVEASQAYRRAQQDGARSIADAQRAVRKAAQELAQAQKEVAKASGEIGARLTESQRRLLNAARGFGRRFTAEMRPANRILNNMATRAIQFAQRGLPTLGNAATRVARAMASGFQRVMRIFAQPKEVEAFKAILRGIAPIMRNLTVAGGRFIAGFLHILRATVPFAKDLSRSIRDIAGDFLRWARQRDNQAAIAKFLRQSADSAKELFPAIAKVVKSLFEFSRSKEAKAIWDFLVDAIKWLGNKGIPGLRKEIAAAKKTFGPLFEAVRKFFNFLNEQREKQEKTKTLWERMGNQTGDAYVGGMRVGINNSDPGIKEFSDRFKRDANGHFGIRSPSTWAAGLGRNLIAGLSGGMQSQKGAASNAMGSVGSSISSRIQSVHLYPIGQNIITGLLNGITSRIPGLQNVLQDLAEAMPDWVKDALGISSPSRVFRGLGEEVSRGFAEGILANAHLAENATRAMAARTFGAMGGGPVAGTVPMLGAGVGGSFAGQTINNATTNMPVSVVINSTDRMTIHREIDRALDSHARRAKYDTGRQGGRI